MRSLRFQFVSFVSVLLLVLLVLLNTYPIISSRDTVFEEKRNSLTSQTSVLASSLGGLDKLSRENVAELLRFLDMSGFSRIVVTDKAGALVYDAGSAGAATEAEDIRTALGGRPVFRSRFADAAFASSMAMPFSSQGKILGAVCLYEFDTEPAEIILSIQTQIRTLSLVIGTAALLLACLFVYLVIHRVRALVLSMRTVAAGDYSHRHVVRGRDEISELGGEFNQLTERLETTEEQRRRFVSDASHELRTPLASIRLLSDSIVQNENMSPDTVREFVSDIGNEAQRLQRTAEKLLTLSRLDDGSLAPPEPADVKQAALDTLVFLRPLAEERGLTLLCQLEEGCRVLAPPDSLFQIIFNLTENAIKYNVPGGTVRLVLEGAPDSVRITVEDTGIGIPEEDRSNIFSRFYRVDKARSREAGGSGLGLSIVHDTVRALGGGIAVEQNTPQGSRFIVTLPRETSEEKDA